VKHRGHNDILQSNEALYVYRLKVFLQQLEIKQSEKESSSTSGSLAHLSIVLAASAPSHRIVWPRQKKVVVAATNTRTTAAAGGNANREKEIEKYSGSVAMTAMSSAVVVADETQSDVDAVSVMVVSNSSPASSL
jgi:hypothetical protein